MVMLKRWTTHSVCSIAEFVDTVNFGMSDSDGQSWIGIQNLTSQVNLFNYISTDAQFTGDISQFTSENVDLFQSLTDS